MPEEWPHLTDDSDIISAQVRTQAKRWRREDMGHHEEDSSPGYEDEIADSLKGLRPMSASFQKRGLVARLVRTFGQEPGVGFGYLRTEAGEKIPLHLVEGTWKALVEGLRALFGDRM